MWSEITRLLLEVWPQARHSQIDLPRVGLKIFTIWSNTPTIQNKIDILKWKLLSSEAFPLMVTQCFSVNWWPVAVLAIDCFMLRMFANHVALSSCQIRTGIRTQLANKTRVSLGQEIHYVGPMLTYKNKRHNDINTVLLLASGHFSHEFGHHAWREANVPWQKLAVACIA